MVLRCVAFRGRERIFIAFFLALGLLFALPSEADARKRQRKVQPYSPAFAALVYDVNSGRVLHSANPDALRHPASITKVMTLYLLFEQLASGRMRLDTDMPVSAEAARQAPSKLGLSAGERLSVEDAILALVTKSANDAAVVVAEAIAGSHEAFARQMTARARALGMSRTVFRNANGLPDPQQVTTARDLATLGQAIHDRFPQYYGYFARRSFTYDGVTFRNHNRLLGRVEGVDGIKTGYVRASGFNLLTSARMDGRHIIAVVLGGRSAGARDAVVASLVEENLPRAVASRRTPRIVDVAAAETRREERPQPARRAAGEDDDAPTATAERNGDVPKPVARPRPAVLAEVRLPAEPTLDQTARAGQAMTARSGGGSTSIRPGAAPLSLAATTPRSPTMRWVAGPQPVSRLVPPGLVPHTNSVSAGAEPERNQSLPQAFTAIETPAASPRPARPDIQKSEARLPSSGASPAVAAQPETTGTAAPGPARSAPEARPTEAPAAASAPAPARLAEPAPPAGGWIIQLAAMDDEDKARALLDSVKSRYPSLLDEAKPFTERVTKGDTVLFRARFAGFDDREAKDACKTLKRAGVACIAQRI